MRASREQFLVGTMPMGDVGKQMLYVEDPRTSDVTWAELTNDQARRLAHRILADLPAA